MTLSGAIVAYAVLWFLCLFVVLPIGVKSQEEMGEVVPGTSGAPANPRTKLKMLWATVLAALCWGVLYVALEREWLTLASFDFIYGPAK